MAFDFAAKRAPSRACCDANLEAGEYGQLAHYLSRITCKPSE